MAARIDPSVRGVVQRHQHGVAGNVANRGTRPSRGSFQSLMSVSTTSGRTRSRRSRKLLSSPQVLVLHRHPERHARRQACVCSQSSRFSIAKPMVSGYMARAPAHFPPLPGWFMAAAGAKPGFTGAAGAGAASEPSGTEAWAASGRPACRHFCFSNSSSRNGFARGFTGTGPV